jgi:hypothetical protein
MRKVNWAQVEPLRPMGSIGGRKAKKGRLGGGP